MRYLLFSFLAFLLCSCACAVTPQAPDVCAPPTASQVVFPPGQEGILEVRQSTDNAGLPFQHGTLYVATETYVSNTNSSSWPHGLAMVMNGQRQTTTVWAGRALGIWHTWQVTDSDVVQNFCPNTMNFWRLDLGFGTLGDTVSDPGFSVVGHQLREGQEVQVRFDVCSAQACEAGLERTVRVHIVP